MNYDSDQDIVFIAQEEEKKSMTIEYIVCATQTRGIRRIIKNGNRTYLALMDSGASINLMNDKIAKDLKLHTEPIRKTINTVRGGIEVKEFVSCNIQIDQLHTRISAFLVKGTDIIIILFIKNGSLSIHIADKVDNQIIVFESLFIHIVIV